MTRLLSIAAAAAVSLTTLGAGAAYAQSGTYAAVPVTKPAKASFIARDTIWTWRDTAYTARRGGDRDAIQCELVARQTGKLASFSVGGTAFDAAALDKCNAKAK